MKFYGLGGQGVVTGAKMLSKAVSLMEDKFAITVPAYGHERRGAPVNTSIIMDDDVVLLNSFVYEPDVVLVMDPLVPNKGVDIAAGIHQDSILVLNTDDAEVLANYQEYGFKEIYHVDATRIAVETIGMSIPNGAMLGALAGTGLVKIESVMETIKNDFGGKKGEINAEAARRSYEQLKKA